LEALETRDLLSTFTWNNPSGGDFNTAANWDRNAVPGASDDAVINTTGITVTSSGNNSINSLTSSALVQIQGGSFNVAATSTSTSFELDNGSLGGTGMLTVSNAFTWTGGTMNGTGATTLANGAVMTISSVNTKALDTRTINLNSGATVNWTGSGEIQYGNGPVWNNSGTFNISSDTNFRFGFGANSATFNNSGTLTKTSLANGTTVFNSTFNNSGTVTVSSGTLQLGGGGISTGTFNQSAAGGTLSIVNNGAAQTLNAGAVLTGPGLVDIAGGVLVVNGSVNATNLELDAGCTLGGTNTLTVSGAFNWTGGTLNGTGATTLTNGAVMTISSVNTKALDTRTININSGATVNWTGNGEIQFGNGPVWNNSGTFNISSDTNFRFGFGANSATINNSGSLTKTSSTGGTTFFGSAFNNTGTVAVSSGTLQLGGGGISPGTFNQTASGAVLSIVNNNVAQTLNTGAVLSGPGLVDIAGGVLNVNGAASAVNMELDAGGSLGGASTLTVSGAFNWTGGTMNGSGATTLAGGAVMTISGLGTKDLDTRTININSGATVNWTGNGEIQFGNGPVWNNNGTFNISSDSNFRQGFGANSATINNVGSLTKTSSTGGTTVLNSTFNNTGTVTVSSGTLQLGGGGISTGVFNQSASNAVLNIVNNAVAQTLNAGAVMSGSGLVDIAGGVLNINGAATATNLELDANGFLNGSNTLTVSGNFNWTGGTMGGTGATTMAGGVLNISGLATKDLDTRTININSGSTANWTGSGEIQFGNGCVWNSNGTFNISSDTSFRYGLGINSATINNAGTLIKTSSTSGTTNLGSTFNNSGTVTVSSGILQLSGSGISSGTFNQNTNGELLFTGSQTLQAGAAFTGAGLADINGGTVNINSPVTAPNLELDNGALGGAGTLSIPNLGVLTWTGGTLGGSGSANLQSGAVLNISGIGTKSLDTCTLNNNAGAVINWSGTGEIHYGNGAIWNNAGLLNILSNTDFRYGLGANAANFNNLSTGVITKQNSSGTSALSSTFNNVGGVINVNSGTLLLSGGASTTGTYTVAQNSLLDLTDGGTQTYSGSFTGSGAGTVTFSSGTLLIAASNASLNFTGGGFLWSGGTISGLGTLTNSGLLTIGGAAVKSMDTFTLTNAGTINWSGSGEIQFGNGTIWNNTGAITISGDTNFRYGLGLNAATFNNAGTITKTSVAGGTTFLGSTFNNVGTVTISSGTLALDGSGLSSGTFNQMSGGTLNLSGGTQTLAAGAMFTGPGLVDITGGDLNVIVPTPAVNIQLDQNGTLSGTDTLTVTGTFTWTGGIQSGSGTTLIAANAAMKIKGANVKYLDGRTLQNSAGAGTTWMDTGEIQFGDAAVWNNNGTLNIQNDSNFRYGVGANVGSINNFGTIIKSSPTTAGTTTLGGAFNNVGGTIQVMNGNLILSGGTSTAGTYVVDANALLDLTGGGTQSYIGTFSGTSAGTIQLSSGAITAPLAGSTLNFSFTGTGSFIWTGGALNGVGTITNQGSMTITGGSVKTLDSLTFANTGTITWTGLGDIDVGNGTFFNNAGTFTINTNANFVQSFGLIATFTNMSGGTINKTSPTGIGSTFVNCIFDNNGQINITSSVGAGSNLTYNLAADGTSTGSSNQGAGTILSLSAGSQNFINASFTGPGLVDITGATVNFFGTVTASQIQIDSGSLSGSGSVGGNLTVNQGTLSPTVGGSGFTTGTVTLKPGSTFSVFLKGINAGSDYSQLQSTGNVNLQDGVLDTTIDPNFTPKAGDAFVIMHSTGAVTGEFKGLPDGATFTLAGQTYQIRYINSASAQPGQVGPNAFFGRVVLVVTPVGTITTVTSNANPSTSASVSLTATVTSSFFGVAAAGLVSPFSGGPTGTVSFLDNGQALSPPIAILNGTAIFAAMLSAGSHSISATYSGDNNFTGSSTLAPLVQIVSPAAAGWHDTLSGDFNGDGKADIASRTAGGQWWVSTSTGSSFVSNLWGTWNEAAGWTDVQVGDFNGDGKADIAGMNSSGQWWVAQSTGSSFVSSLWVTWNPNVTWVDVKVGDFNGDGRADIVGRYQQTGQWWVAQSTGSSFTNSLWGTWNPNVTWVDVKVGDFNGDKKSDLTSRWLQGGSWWAAISTGSSFVTSMWATWNPNVTWVDVQVGDFNGDGKADITGRWLQGGSWWTAVSTGSSFVTSLWAAWNPNVNWVDVKVGDFNGDGKPDITARFADTGQWWTALSTGSSFNTTLWDSWSPAVTWVDVSAGDFNGDGAADIAGRIQVNGQWWVAQSNGSSAFSNQLWTTWAP
jgi:hypothetical protein